MRSMRRRHRSLRALVASAAVVAVLMGLLASGGTDAADTQEANDDVPAVISTSVSNVDTLFESPYDWDRLRVDDRGRYVYLGQDGVSSRVGIDVSEHQAAIDWQRVAADGISFAIVRIGYRGSTGALAKDSTFDYNLQQARAAGMDVGVYFYSLATTADEAREEADFAVRALEGAALEYPIAFDIEPTGEASDRLASLTKDEMTEIALAFCERAEAAGYTTCIYGNQTDLSRFHLMRLADRGFWYAQYDERPTMALRFALWQYTQQGTVDGIEGSVDLDLDLTTLLNVTGG